MDIPKLLEEKKKVVDKVIEDYLPRKVDKKYVEKALGTLAYEPDVEAFQKAIADPIWDFLDRGGKRWRPVLFLLTAEAFGAGDVRDFTLLIELLHNGSIMVDDIEDSGELRRGRPCTHKLFGVDVAINAGNMMYFLPLLVFLKNKGPAPLLLRAYHAFAQEMIAIHVGQGTDIWWHKGGGNPAESQYLQMCAFKTGTLARLAGRLGVILAGGTEEQEKKIGKAFEAIGVAFQIKDDILSVSGGTFAEKKGFGDDITEGKRSLVVIYTLEKASPAGRQRLREILGMNTTDRKLIQEAIDIIQKSGAVEKAKKKAEEIVRKAWQDAEKVIPQSPAKETLREFVRFLVERET